MAAYLARFKGQSRLRTDSDLRVFLRWCTARGLDPLTAQRHDLKLYVRWLQETRRYKPSTVSRRTSVIVNSRVTPRARRHRNSAPWPCGSRGSRPHCRSPAAAQPSRPRSNVRTCRVATVLRPASRSACRLIQRQPEGMTSVLAPTGFGEPVSSTAGPAAASRATWSSRKRPLAAS